MPVRAPMLAAGQLDAVLGFSFRIYVDLKDRGVPVDDIVLLPMANYGLKLYGNAIIVNSKFAAEKPEAVKAFLQRLPAGACKETIRQPGDGRRLGRSSATTPPRRRSSSSACGWRSATTSSRRRCEPMASARSTPARLEESIEQIALTYTFKAKPKAGGHLRRLVPAAARGAQGQLN